MAKAKAAAKPVEEEVVKSVPAVRAKGGALATDDGWGDYTGAKGNENFGAEDISIPRLKLLQALSPEVKDGLGEVGDLYHNVLKEVILPAGERLRFIPICGDKQYLLWRDRNDGGGIMARANRVVTPQGVRYAWDKPNTTFEHKITQAKILVKWKTARFIEEDGLSEFGTAMPGNLESMPAATLHYNYVFMLPDFDHMMCAVSLARTAAKRAKDLNAILKMGNAPQWARILELATVKERKDENEWFNWVFQPSSIMRPDDPLVTQLQRLNEELAKRGINVDFSDEEAGGTADATDAGVDQETGKATKRF